MMRTLFAFAIVVLAVCLAPALAQIPSWAANCPRLINPRCPSSACQSGGCLPTFPLYNCTLPPGVLESANELFPNGQKPDPSLLGGLAPIKILFSQRANVNFTIVTEGAGYRNVLGFFQYNESNPNAAARASNFTVIFPDVSIPSGGDTNGCLRPGYTVGGTVMPANTHMGLFLRSNGYGQTRFDTWYSFTDGVQLVNSDGKNHTAFVYLTDLNTTMFTFEDFRGGGDEDYNDVMFTFSTDALINLNQVPRFEGGVIQTCRVGVIASQDYLEYKCQQWALLSPPSGAACNTFLQPPSGWTWAVNGSEVLEMLQSAGAGTFSRTLGANSEACAVVHINTTQATFTSYASNGAPCDSLESVSMVRFRDNANCFAVPCAHRLLIKGAAVASCTANTFQFCDPSVGATVSNRVPSTIPQLGDPIYPTTAAYPATATVYMTPGSSLNLNLSVIYKNSLQGGVASDLYFLFDLHGAFSNDFDYLSQAMVEFYNEITNPNTIAFDAPNIGFGIYRRSNSVVSFANNCPLNPSVTQIRDCIGGLKNTYTSLPSASTTQDVSSATILAMQQLTSQYRSFAYKMLIVISDATTVTSDSLSAQLADAMRMYNIVPMFWQPNPPTATVTQYQTIANALPLPARYTYRTRAQGSFSSTRMEQWHRVLPANVKTTTQKVVVTRMAGTAGNALRNSFIGTIPPTLDLSNPVRTGTFDLPVGLTWPAGTTAASTSYPVTPIVNILGFGRTEIAIFTNRAPLAPDTPVFTNENVDITFTIAASDIDDNLLRVRFLNRTNPSLGTLFSGNDPVALNTYYDSTTFRFSPASQQNGFALLAFEVNDGCISSAIKFLNITVRPSNDAPTAMNFTVVVDENDNSLSNVAEILFGSFINDVDNDVSSLTITIASVPSTTLGDLRDPSPATLIRQSYSLGTKRRLTFTPLAYESGTTSFIYRVSDGLLSAEATVTIVVTDKRWAPTLTVTPNPVTANVGNITSISISIADPDGFKTANNEAVQIRIVSSSFDNGNQIVVRDGLFAVNDNTFAGRNWTNLASVDTSSIRNYVANWTAASTNADQILTIIAVDSQGLMSDPTTIVLKVSGNTRPVIVNNPSSLTVDEDGVLGPFDLQATDVDKLGNIDPNEPEWRNLTIRFITLPRFGSLTLKSTADVSITPTNSRFQIALGSLNVSLTTSVYKIVYQPRANYFGPDSFSYVFIDENEGVSDAATSQITVGPVNDQPTASSFTVSMFGWFDVDSKVQTPVTDFSAFDVDGDPLALTLLTLPARGLLYFQGSLVESSSLPLNVGGPANWSFVYEPPFLEFSNPDGAEFTNVTFRVCDNSGSLNSCSETARVTLVVNFQNTPPLSENLDIYTPENTVAVITLPARDVDERHPDEVLFAVVTSLGVRNKGKLYLCAELSASCELTISRVNERINSPRRIWYQPLRDDYSTPAAPSATFTFQVGDTNLNTAVTYTVKIFVDFINDPPQWLAATTYDVDEDTTFSLFTLASNNWFDDLLNVPDTLRRNPGAPVVTYSVKSVPARGTLSICTATGDCTPVTSASLPITSDDPLGRILFRPAADEFASNYAQFVFTLTDSGDPFGPQRSVDVTITINVVPVNDPPVFEPLNFKTVESGADGPVMNEDSSVTLSWTLTDVDTLPNELVTRVRASTLSRGGWNVFSCIQDGFEGCNPGPLISNQADAFRNAIMSFEVVNTTCNLVVGKPITDFTGCYAMFTVLFTPEANRYQIPYVKFAFTGFDQSDEGNPGSTVISVLPVNDAPVILAPATISPAAGVSEMDILDETTRPPADFPFALRSDTERTNGIFAWDPDANPAGAIERLTVEVVSGDGTFLPHPALNCNQTSDFVYQCETTINIMNRRLKQSKFRVNTEFGATDATVVWTINDLGNTSPEDRPIPLSANATTRFVFTKLPEIGAVPPPNNNLTLAAGIAAAAGLIIIALLAWRLRKALKAPDNSYFEVATQNLSIAPTNPLFKPQFKDHTNPLYQNANA